MDDEKTCGACQHWHVAEGLEYWGICYFNSADKPTNRITGEDEDCYCELFTPTA